MKPTKPPALPAAGAPIGNATSADEIGKLPIVRACLMYAVSFSVSGLFQPYFPVWLTSRGFADSQIALVVSAPMILRLAVTPLLGAAADRAGNYRTFVTILSSIVLTFSVALSMASGFWPIFLIATTMTVVWQSIPPINDASVMRLVRRGIARDFGRVRLWGSVGFASAAAAGGFILGRAGPDGVFMALVAAMACVVAASFAMPVVRPAPSAAPRAKLELLRRPLLLVVFLAAALVLASQTMFNTFGTVHMRELGFPAGAIGLLWTLATSAEVAMFWAGPVIASYLGPIGLLALAAGAAIVRWNLMSLDPGIALTALLQLLHAATFSGTYLGLMGFVRNAVEDEVGARAQSAFATMLGLLTAATTLAMGPLYRHLGAGAYQVASVLPLVSLVLVVIFGARLRAAVARATPE